MKNQKIHFLQKYLFQYFQKKTVFQHFIKSFFLFLKILTKYFFPKLSDFHRVSIVSEFLSFRSDEYQARFRNYPTFGLLSVNSELLNTFSEYRNGLL